MTNTVEITFGNSRARIALTGSALVALNLHGTELIPEIENPVASFAGSLLAPWPNRIASGTYAFQGESFHLPVGDGRGNALHGLAFNQLATIQSLSESKVTLSQTIGPVAGYPYSIEVLSTFTISESEIRVTHSAKNLADTSAPLGLGAHPYFPYSKNTSVEILASTYSIHGEDMIPDTEEPISKLGLGPGRQRLVGDLSLDTQFSKFDKKHNGTVCRLRNEQGVVEIFQENADWLMVYTTQEFSWLEGFGAAIAIEPQTCAVDAFNNQNGLAILKPGESLDLTWGVRFAAN